MHLPETAVPKDGPSAGITVATALISAFTGRKCYHQLAMTGEITLRGRVLPVGGIKEKVIAAATAGIERVMLPARNRRDFDDIPEDIRRNLEFVWLANLDEAVKAALEPGPAAARTAA